MKCLLISQDNLLRMEIEKLIPELEQIVQCSKSDIPLDQTFQVTIVSDREMSYEEMKELKMISSEHIVYLISNYPNKNLIENIKTIAISLGVQTISPKLSPSEIAQEIRWMYFSDNVKTGNKKVISFIGSHRDIGLTSTVLSIADLLSTKTNNKICVLNLSAFSDGDDFIMDYQGMYLDHLYTQIKTNVLKPDQLINALHKMKTSKFHYLAGNRDTRNRYRYSIEAVQTLIDLVQDQFDLVLIDAGAEPENALCIKALMKADFKLFVTTQQIKGIKFIRNYLNDILYSLDMSKEDFMLIVNKSSELGNDPETISRITGIPLLGKLEFIGVHAFNCENEKKLLTSLPDKTKKDVRYNTYINDLNNLVEILIDRYHLERKNESSKGKILQPFASLFSIK